MKTISACFFILILVGSISAFANFPTQATIGNFFSLSYAKEKNREREV